MNDLILVAGMHGDEHTPVVTLAANNIPFIVANPGALVERKRFIDMDMNKAFGTGGSTYEEKRASEILNLIPKESRVIDFHSMSADSDPFAIVVDTNMIPFAKTLGLKHIVIMTFNIKNGHALINYVNGVSVETGFHTSQKAAEITLQVVENANKKVETSAQVYEVYDIITEPGEYKNFEMHESGFIPVLAGEKAYDFYGLKARIAS